MALLALALGFGMAAAQAVSPENDVPSWAADSTMQLSMSSDNGDILPLDYTIIPSTQNAGLNGSYVVRGVCSSPIFVIYDDPQTDYLLCHRLSR